MQAPQHPEIVLPILVGEAGVVGISRRVRCRPPDGQITGVGPRLGVVVHRRDRRSVRDILHRRRQEGQRHGCLQRTTRAGARPVSARRHDVIKNDTRSRLLAQHPEGTHRGAPVGGRVIQQDERLRRVARTGGDIQIIPQGVSLIAEHQRVLLVRIIAGQQQIVLRVDRPVRLQAFQGAAAVVARQHDLGRSRRPRQRVTPDDRRPVDGLEAVDLVLHRVGLIFPEPPDVERVPRGNCVHGDDRPPVRRLEATHERIPIGHGVKRIAVGLQDVAGQIRSRRAQLTTRRSDAAAHLRRLAHHPRSAGDAVRPVERVVGGIPRGQVRGDRAGEQRRRFQVHLQPREHPLEGHPIPRRETQERAVGRVAGIQKAVELELGRQLAAWVVQGILILNGGHVVRGQEHGGQRGLLLRGHQRPDVMTVFGHVAGPDKLVARIDGRPAQARKALLQPVHHHVVLVGRLPRSVVFHPGAAVDAVLVEEGLGRAHQQRRGIEVRVRPRVCVGGDFLAQFRRDIRGHGLLEDIHDLVAQMLPRLAADCIAQQFQEDPPLPVVGEDLPLLMVIPERAHLLESVGRDEGLARGYVGRRHALGESAAVADPHPAHPRRGHGHRLASVAERPLRPVNLAGRFDRTARHHVIRVRQSVVDPANGGHQPHVRAGLRLPPGDLNRPRLDGKDGLRVRAPVIRCVRVAVRGVRFGSPISHVVGKGSPILIRDGRCDDRAEEVGHLPAQVGRADLRRAQHYQHGPCAVGQTRQVQIRRASVLRVVAAGVQVGPARAHDGPIRHEAAKLLGRSGGAGRAAIRAGGRAGGVGERHAPHGAVVHTALVGVGVGVKQRRLVKLRDTCDNWKGQPRQRPCTESQQEVRKSFHKWIAA